MIGEPEPAWFIDQYWKMSGDDWAIPDHLMVAFGLAMFRAGVETAEQVMES